MASRVIEGTNSGHTEAGEAGADCKRDMQSSNRAENENKIPPQIIVYAPQVIQRIIPELTLIYDV